MCGLSSNIEHDNWGGNAAAQFIPRSSYGLNTDRRTIAET
jgi:hypothetical protein